MALDKNDMKRRMDGSVDQLKTEFIGLRTGRASTNMLETVMYFPLELWTNAAG